MKSAGVENVGVVEDAGIVKSIGADGWRLQSFGPRNQCPGNDRFAGQDGQHQAHKSGRGNGKLGHPGGTHHAKYTGRVACSPIANFIDHSTGTFGMTVKFCCHVWAVFAVGLLATSPVFADSWPGFHGPDARGIAPEGQLPLLGESTKPIWTQTLGSRDVGSPIVVNDRIYLLRSDPQAAMISLDCRNLSDGELVWSVQKPQQVYHLHLRNTLASATPAADDDHLYWAYSDGRHTWLIATGYDGQEVWTRDFGRWQSQHGFGTSPLVVGDQVVLFYSQQAEQLKPGDQPGQSRMISVDRATGETRWETELASTRTSYGVPAIVRDDNGRPTMLVAANTGNGIFGLDPSDGRLLFDSDVFDKRCCSSPLLFGNLAIGTCGSGGGGNQLVAVELPSLESGNTGSDTEAREVYRVTSGAPYVPTSVISNGLIFAVDDRGIASCIDAKTGKTQKRQRLGGNYGASPILAGDRWLVISLDGVATVMSADQEMSVLSVKELGLPVGATPAIADGRLLIRAGDQLLCFDADEN